MLIGITFDLREEYLALGYSGADVVELDEPETVEALERALAALGHRPVRVGSHRSLVRALLDGERWDLVLNIAEGMHGLGREALVPCLLDEWRIPYVFSDPVVLGLCLHKGLCKRVVRQLGVPTADFAVVEEPGDADAVDLPWPLLAKPVAEGTGKGIDHRSRVDDRDALRAACVDLLERFRQPVLVEAFLPGREFTVGLVGTGSRARVAGVMEVLVDDRDRVYSGHAKESYLDLVRYALLEDPVLGRRVEEVALAAWRGLGCRDGGRVDIRLDRDGTPCFLEVNPLAGLHPVHSDLPIMVRLGGGTYQGLVADILGSALERVDRAHRRPAR